MKPYAAETSTLQRLWKLPMTEVIGVERRASLAAEDKVRASVGGLEGPKGLLEGRRHVDGAPGPSGLESADCAVPERPPDVNLVFREVDVVPLQPKELTLTHPGEDRHQEQRPQRLLLRIEQPTDLLRGEDVHLLILTPRPLHVLHRISVEIPPPDCMFEHLLQDHDHVADGLGRQALAEQRFDELLGARQGDLSQLHRPEKGLDVAIEVALIGTKGGRLEATQLMLDGEVVRLPRFDELGHGHLVPRHSGLPRTAFPHPLRQYLSSLVQIWPDRFPPPPAAALVVRDDVVASPFPDGSHFIASFRWEAMPAPSDLAGHDVHEGHL